MRIELVLLGACTSTLLAGSADDAFEIPVADPSSQWGLTLAPYAWVTSTEGDMGVAGLVAPVDISFKDTLEDLETAFMLSIEGSMDRWDFGLDGIYGASSSSTTLSMLGKPQAEATLEMDQFFGRIHIGYQVSRWENAKLTAFAGARYSYFSSEISLVGPRANKIVVDGSASWLDPVVGMHGIWDINQRWFLYGDGDIGGFGVASDKVWQANVLVGYRFTESIAVLAGYRALGIEASDGGFHVDMVSHGPVIGVSVRF